MKKEIDQHLFLEKRINDLAKANNMKKNGNNLYALQFHVDVAVDKTKKRTSYDNTQFSDFLFEATKGLKNPEAWAVMECIEEEMKYIGWKRYANGYFK